MQSGEGVLSVCLCEGVIGRRRRRTWSVGGEVPRGVSGSASGAAAAGTDAGEAGYDAGTEEGSVDVVARVSVVVDVAMVDEAAMGSTPAPL